MNLHEYFQSPGALSLEELSARVGVKQTAQVRQWQHGYGGRRPSPANCVALERATGGAVRRWDLRPADWWENWPELIGADGAPPVPTVEVARSEPV